MKEKVFKKLPEGFSLFDPLHNILLVSSTFRSASVVLLDEIQNVCVPDTVRDLYYAMVDSIEVFYQFVNQLNISKNAKEK